MSIKTWCDDLLSRWYIPRSDYDERLTEIQRVHKENREMFLIHQDYVKAQLQAPRLHQVEVPDFQQHLVWYSQPETWPPRFNQPSHVKVEMVKVEEHHERILEFRASIRIDQATLLHYKKYSGGLFRDLGLRLLVDLFKSVLS